MLGDTEARLKSETDKVKLVLEKRLDEVDTGMEDLRGRVDKQDQKIDRLASDIPALVDRQLEKALGRKPPDKDNNCMGWGGDDCVESSSSSLSYASVASAILPAAATPAVAQKKRPARTNEDAYWDCRHALRIRPLPKGEDKEEVRKYLSDKLKLSGDFITCLGHFTVERIPSGPKSKVKGEAIVTFSNIDTRDAVKGAARNLAGLGSEYGVQHEIPNHLKTAMSALQSISWEIKQKHPDSKRNVLFDDQTLDLVLDFCVCEDPWRRLTSRQAREKKKKMKAAEKFALEDDEIDALLGRDCPASP